jgi:ribosomal protein L7Ae-like RNA K-turn-binding protein
LNGLEQKVGRLVGLGRRGGKVVLGVPQVEQALRGGRARLVLLASDGSFGQKKGPIGLARGSGVRVEERFSGQVLAAWVGVERVTALAVTDASLAAGIAEKLDEQGPGEEVG